MNLRRNLQRLAPAVWAAALLATPTHVLAAPGAIPMAAKQKGAAGAQSQKLRSVAPAVPIPFEENRGQADAGAKFVSRGEAYTLLLGDQYATLALGLRDHPRRSLRMEFVGTNRHGTLAGMEALPGKIYYAPHDAKGVLIGSPTFRRVKDTSLYPGVDLVYYRAERQLEFDFVVAADADPGAIRLSFAGADEVHLDAAAGLVVRAGGDEVHVKQPAIYQERDGVRETVEGGYTLDPRSHEVSVWLGKYDTSRPLVIDPVIAFATVIGGSGSDIANAMQLGPNGEIYLFGGTQDAASFPTTRTFALQPPDGQGDCFLTKLSPDGTTLLYSVIFQGSSCEDGDMVVDSQGNVHFSMFSGGLNMLRTLTDDGQGGLTLSLLKGVFDFQNGPAEHLAVDPSGNVYMIVLYQPDGATGPRYDLFKVDNTGLVGSIPLMTPFIDQNAVPFPEQVDQLTGLTVDDSGRASVIGIAQSSTSIIPTANALQPARRDVCVSGALPPHCGDGVVIQVDTNTGGPFQLLYASYLGGLSDDRPGAIAHDPSGAVYITGTSSSDDFPTTPGAWQTKRRSDLPIDVFLVKLDLAQPDPSQQLSFGTFLGELENGGGLSIVVLPGGTPAVAGSSEGGLTLVNPLFGNLTSSESPFVAVFSPDGSTLTFSSFLNTSGIGFDVQLAANGSQFLYAAVTEQDDDTQGAFQLGSARLVRYCRASDRCHGCSASRRASRASISARM